MKKIILLFILLTTLPITALAVTLPWSTSFNCADWSQPQSSNCDGIAVNNWTCSGSGSTVDRILPAANNPNGGGGSGYAHAIGDGVNNGGGSFSVSFSPQTELWIRMYLKYPPGFAWSGLSYEKLLYLNVRIGNYAILDWEGSDGLQFYTSAWYGCNNCGWTSSNIGDGNWHSLEWHVNANGVSDGWIDGVQKFHVTGASMPGSFSNLEFLTNQKSPSNGGCVDVYLDDIAISNTGYIGPVSGTSPITVKPNPPTNLR
jgi:hypothetical protein